MIIYQGNCLHLLLSKYEELAARRFRQYKWEKRIGALEGQLLALAVKVFQKSMPILEQAGLSKRRAVEKVRVE
jgi:hypothetical protein